MLNEWARRGRALALVARCSIGVVVALAVLGSLGCADEDGHDEQPVTLKVTVRSPSRAVLLEWSHGPPGVRRWQYAVQTLDPETKDWVGEWRDVPRRRTDSNRLEVFGLEPNRLYVFRVRPATLEHALSDPIDRPNLDAGRWPWLRIPERGADSIAHADSLVPLYGGDTYRLGRTPYLFTVPREGSWEVSGGGSDYWSMVVEHIESDALLFINPRTGAEDIELTGTSYLDRARQAKTEEERDGYRLLGEILNSVRYAPEESDLRIVVEGDGEVRLEWPPLRHITHWEYRAGIGPPKNIAWGGWHRLAGDAKAVRVSVELPDVVAWNHAWHFEVRPWTRDGPGAPRIASFDAERELHDGVPQVVVDDSPQSAVIVHAGGHAWRDEDYVFDVPGDMLLRYRAWGFKSEEVPFGWTVHRLLIDEVSGSYLLLHGSTREVMARLARPHPRGVDTEAMLDDLQYSIRYSPAALNEPLLVLVGLGARELLLTWKPAPTALRWQYRHRGRSWGGGDGRWEDWSPWVDVPGSDAGVSSVRVGGLEQVQRRCHTFEVRHWTTEGPSTATAAAKCVERATMDIPPASGFLESGGAYRACQSGIVFSVPTGMLVHVRCYDAALQSDTLLHPIVITDVASGSRLYLGGRTGAEVGRYISRHTAGRDVNTPFDHIAESARVRPTPP